MTDLNNDLNLDLNDLDLGGPSSDAPAPVSSNDMRFIRNIPVNLTLEVASTELKVGDLMNINVGSVIELDKLSGEPMDVRVNGTLLGHAEVVVVNNKYGLRLVNVVDEKDMLRGLAN
ncbi:flagellar motor switch protein FliN [Grimontia hollisae]|uniref:Flagellar motor switch protein FliN n=1 Tax=Grimontia hollisae CIP 101886 TaxID=675812 RepID=D0I457_GRIHO|nr:flagellar motor switch protein FliN [Grimontia hollisae]AMG30501.1 flagellar motor switch protein FliN [Grimontia hollisae]EEY73835.1 flagellar motor switch protein FliN [Grimontia hollisae CIP 101886]MDF2183772.1 flagellar motor switch protein FliN [Grimontia hollisae]STO41900.1 Flagellar motor switch protein FliN [Grimontia hollisae]STQ77853.1 Flagellar motor switch protein FliN [Grimontia hollisae]